jgi:hypothetical protein
MEAFRSDPHSRCAVGVVETDITNLRGQDTELLICRFVALAGKYHLPLGFLYLGCQLSRRLLGN